MAWWTVQWFQNSFTAKFKSQYTTKVKETINYRYTCLKAVAVKYLVISSPDGNNLVENFSHSKKHLEQFLKGGQSFFHNLCINLYKLDVVRPSIRLSDYSDSPFSLVLLVLLSFPNLVTITFRDLILKIQLTGVLTFLSFPNKSLQKSISVIWLDHI